MARRGQGRGKHLVGWGARSLNAVLEPDELPIARTTGLTALKCALNADHQRWVKYNIVQVQVPLPYRPNQVQVQVCKLEFKKF